MRAGRRRPRSRNLRAPRAFLRDAHHAVGETTRSSEKTREKLEPPARVLVHNDDFTPMEFVTAVLHDVFRLPWHRAAWVMLKAHVGGVALVDVLPRAQAEAWVREAMDRARQNGWPLLLSVEAPEA